MFAHLNDDVLYGEVWNEQAIIVKTKYIIMVMALIAMVDFLLGRAIMHRFLPNKYRSST